MRILFMTTSPLESNSSASIRNIALIKGLSELGHDVSIVAPKNTTKSKDNSLNEHVKSITRYDLAIYNHEGNSSTGKEKKIRDNIYSILRYIYHSLFVFDRYKVHVNKISKLSILQQEKFDLLITSSDPKSAHLLGRRYIQEFDKDIKWIQYWGDPILLDITSKLKLPRFLIKKIELKILRESHASVFVSPVTYEEQRRIYPTIANKMHFVLPPSIEKTIYKRDTNIENNIVQLGYYGAYYSAIRNIQSLYDTVEKNKEFKLEIVGNSDLNLDEKPNISIHEREPFSLVKEREKEADILVCICNKRGTQIPGKVYQYASTNKPILLILDGNYQIMIKEYFGRFNRFYICENDPTSIENAINSIVNDMEKIEYTPLQATKPEVVAENFLQLLDLERL